MPNTRIFKVANDSSFTKYRKYTESELLDNINEIGANCLDFLGMIKKLDDGKVQVISTGYNKNVFIKLEF